MKRLNQPTLSTLIICIISVVTLGLAVSSASAQRNGLQYRAVNVGSDRDIDDQFNELAEDGWYPRFVLKYQGNARLIFERPRDRNERRENLEYRATVIRSGSEIDDTFNYLAEDGWFPRFVFRTGALNTNWRLMMERDPDNLVTDLEYRAVVINQGRNVDDTFNDLAMDGWYPLFLIQGSDDHRMLFARGMEETEHTMEFISRTSRNIRQIDDLYDDEGEEGWEPMFLFKEDSGVYRTLFERPIDEEDWVPLEFQARRIGEISEIDDKFNQYAADDWYPIFVIEDILETEEEYEDDDGKELTRTVQEVRWRMLFGRTYE